MCISSPRGLPCRSAVSVGLGGWTILGWVRRPSEEMGLSFL